MSAEITKQDMLGLKKLFWDRYNIPSGASKMEASKIIAAHHLRVPEDRLSIVDFNFGPEAESLLSWTCGQSGGVNDRGLDVTLYHTKHEVRKPLNLPVLEFVVVELGDISYLAVREEDFEKMGQFMKVYASGKIQKYRDAQYKRMGL